VFVLNAIIMTAVSNALAAKDDFREFDLGNTMFFILGFILNILDR
jgi:hypothetical protein